jgi:hypothetical protein
MTQENRNKVKEFFNAEKKQKAAPVSGCGSLQEWARVQPPRRPPTFY